MTKPLPRINPLTAPAEILPHQADTPLSPPLSPPLTLSEVLEKPEPPKDPEAPAARYRLDHLQHLAHDGKSYYPGRTYDFAPADLYEGGWLDCQIKAGLFSPVK
jgi:hypothetical protein